jgi:hypothetical protein
MLDNDLYDNYLQNTCGACSLEAELKFSISIKEVFLRFWGVFGFLVKNYAKGVIFRQIQFSSKIRFL